MNQRRRLGLSILAVLTLAALVLPRQLVAESGARADPIRRTLVFRGTEREYFVYLPAVGEGEFLQDVLRDVRKAYPLQPKMLLTGYSRGGQFAHRFALTFPDQVRAVAPLASGTWTTPDGRFLVEELGEVRNPRTFLSNASNASAIPARLKDLFEPRITTVVDSKAAAGAQNVPFLVMCGTLDPRLPIAKEFVRSLEALGYQVEVEWPRTPHLCGDVESRADCQAEFQKYSRGAAAFFQNIVQGRVR